MLTPTIEKIIFLSSAIIHVILIVFCPISGIGYKDTIKTAN